MHYGRKSSKEEITQSQDCQSRHEVSESMSTSFQLSSGVGQLKILLYERKKFGKLDAGGEQTGDP